MRQRANQPRCRRITDRKGLYHCSRYVCQRGWRHCFVFRMVEEPFSCSFWQDAPSLRGTVKSLPGQSHGTDDRGGIEQRPAKNAGKGAYRAGTGHLWPRSEEHTSELQSLMRISYAVFSLKKKTKL